MRVGVFGGTFDPVHYGHLLAAETCREQLNLDLVRFIPAAVSGYPEFVVDRRELKRPGPSFTVDTLEAIAADSPEDELIFLMGADSLRDFLTWKEPERIAQLSALAVCNRPGVAPISDVQIVEWVGSEIAKRVVTVAIPGTDISASEIRRRAAKGKSLRFRTPRAVEAFIKENRLYEPALLN